MKTFNRNIVYLVVLVGFATCYTVSFVHADVLQIFPNPTPLDDGVFGQFVGSFGNNALVGDPDDDTAGPIEAGAVYLFDTDSGDLVRTILNPEPVGDAHFGTFAAQVGDHLVIGAERFNQRLPGRAYIMDGFTGGLIETLASPLPTTFDQFGWSGAGVGNTFVVSSRLDDTFGANAGAAYQFDATSGDLIRTIPNPFPGVGDEFGFRVAAVNENVVISALRDNAGVGAAYLFDGSTGGHLQTFLNPSPAIDDNFGHSVGAVGTNVIVGAPEDDTVGENAGAAYLFESATGNVLQTFFNPSPSPNDRFGYSVTGIDNHVIVGAPGVNVYIFNASTGHLEETIPNPTGVRDGFGGSLAIVGNSLLVGAESAGVNRAGQAYLIDILDEPISIVVDIKPGSDPNSVNLKSKGLLPVAVASTDDFNVADLDVGSILFGDPLLIDAGGTPVSPFRSSLEDVTNDGLLDLSLKFSIPELVENGVLGLFSETGLLTGNTLDGQGVMGTDSLNIVTRPTPEPSALMLATLAMLSAVFVHRRSATEK